MTAAARERPRRGGSCVRRRGRRGQDHRRGGDRRSRARWTGGSALVCTIDPAQRLANALGLAALGNVETRVPDAQLAAAGLRAAGELHAMMLDMKRTWDDLIDAPRARPGAARAHPQNRLYQQLSAALAGSQEYMAMEKLCELRHRARLRPHRPRHAADGPRARLPGRAQPDPRLPRQRGGARAPRARARRRARWGCGCSARRQLLRRRRSRGSPAQGGALRPRRLPAELPGHVRGVQGARGARSTRSSRAPTSASCSSRSPSPLAVDEALAFHERLHAESMPIAGVVANRVTPDLWQRAGRSPGPPALAAAACSRPAAGAGRGARGAARRGARGAPGARGRGAPALEPLFARIEARTRCPAARGGGARPRAGLAPVLAHERL